MKWLLLLTLLLPSCAPSPWTHTNTALEVTHQALWVADWSQTLKLTEREGMYETNPILGSHPSREKVNAYFIAGIVGHGVISYLLPEPYRTSWQSVTIIFEIPMVINNYNLGVGVAW